MVTPDVVILGGGLQGLVLLRELTAAGYGCVLVTKGHLGRGQTLHSHGLLNSGTGLLTGALEEELHKVTLPYLRRLNVAVYGDDRSFLLAPSELLDQLAPVWEANGYHPEPIQPSLLPRGLEPVAPAYRVRGFNLDKRRLVEALSAGLEHLVLQGEVVAADDGLQVRETASGEILLLSPRAVVVAAGCGTKQLLGDVFGVDEVVLARITYTKAHMICVRGPAEVLPDIGTVLFPGLIVVGHPVAGGGRSQERLVNWYVTPGDAAPTTYADAPDDAAADVEPPAVTSGIEALVRLFPRLADDHEQIEATVFAGYKQNFDGQPTRRACELVDGERNVVMALPSVLANAVPNAFDAVSILRGRLEATGPENETARPGGARIGELNEHTAESQWTSWGDFARSYGAGVA